jgi:hypothetical protein
VAANFLSSELLVDARKCAMSEVYLPNRKGLKEVELKDGIEMRWGLVGVSFHDVGGRCCED